MILGLHETANVNIFATSSDGDVMKFLNGHMYKLPEAVTKNKELQGEIKHKIVQAVQGMFLPAQLHLDSLQGKRSVKAIKDALRKLATGSSAYDSAYEEAMERIEGQLDEQKTLAKDALSWIVCARRPLETLELQHALAVERGTTELDEDNITELEDIVSVCAGLVTIDEESGVIRLVHYTTQEYFERTAEQWLPTYFGLKEAFIMVLERSRKVVDINARDDDEFTPLFYAVMGGKADFISWLLSVDEVEADLKSSKFKSYTPVHIAAMMGNVVGILPFIESDKADLDIEDSWGQTPLEKAARGGYVEIVKALVESDRVCVNSPARTPLTHAAGKGRVEVVKFLLGTGKVNANEANKFGETPLNNALYSGTADTARCLLDSGQVDASLSVEGFLGKTPLERALQNFGLHDSITELILDRMEAIGISTEARTHAWEVCQQLPYAGVYNFYEIHT
ncbi:Alpha-latrocrustotoxin-Lt1a [Colletotrichum fructicola]|nr:Alpha-latrocrustotoxin-Lt1a [Colletotrichum fructicola]